MKLHPYEKVAALLIAFGDEMASEILKKLPMREAKGVSKTMSKMGPLDEETVNQVVEDFYKALQKENTTVVGNVQNTQALIQKAFKGEKADQMSRSLQENSPQFTFLEHVEGRVIASILGSELPQTKAIVLAHLNPQKAGETLKYFSEEEHTDILLRIAQLDTISFDMLEELQNTLREEVAKFKSSEGSKKGGQRAVSEMLAGLDKTAANKLLADLAERDADLAKKIRDQMVIFDDLVKLSDLDIQTVLKAVPLKEWPLALKTATADVKTKIFKNLSQRTQETIKEEIENLGKVRLADVEVQQSKIMDKVRQLEEDGKISFS